ncbi:MAG TPA: hypothetical protein VL357_12060 [Rariglobus sp.]|jgi:hypothetical protein|nr:hypothetical protein [Rariglobus sp.]
MKKLLLLLSLVFLTGCNPSTLVEKIADKEKQRIALDYIHRLATDDPAMLVAELDLRVKSGSALASLTKLQAALPKEAPGVTNLVGYQVYYSSDTGTRNDLTYQLGYGSKWWLVHVAWRELAGGNRAIIALEARPLSKSLQEINAFSFKHARGRHFLFLGAAILVPLFILPTLLVCIKTKIRRRKWLWIIIVLVGVVQFSINWTTGEISFSPFSFLLFGASAMATSLYSPWIISFAIPAGAILFWIKRPKLMQSETPPPVPENTTPPPLS